jgi:hypothetical protein
METAATAEPSKAAPQPELYTPETVLLPQNIRIIGLAVSVTEEYPLLQQKLDDNLQTGQAAANHIDSRGWRESSPYRTFVCGSNLAGELTRLDWRPTSVMLAVSCRRRAACGHRIEATP